MNRVPHDGNDYRICDEILNGLFKEVKSNYVEPAYRTQAVPPTPPVNGFGS